MSEDTKDTQAGATLAIAALREQWYAVQEAEMAFDIAKAKWNAMIAAEKRRQGLGPTDDLVVWPEPSEKPVP